MARDLISIFEEFDPFQYLIYLKCWNLSTRFFFVVVLEQMLKNRIEINREEQFIYC